MSSGYRLAPHLGARLLGALLVLLAVLVAVVTFLAAVFNWSTVVVLGFAGVGVVLVVTVGYLLLRVRVVALDERGYRIRLVRGAGVKAARWGEVSDAVTGDVGGVDCVVLHLKDDRATTIPVQAVAGDRNRLVEDVREHLRRAEGLRPL